MYLHTYLLRGVFLPTPAYTAPRATAVTAVVVSQRTLLAGRLAQVVPSPVAAVGDSTPQYEG